MHFLSALKGYSIMTGFEGFISVVNGLGLILILFIFVNYFIAKKQGDTAKEPYYLRLGVFIIVVMFTGTIGAQVIMHIITNT